MAEEYVDDVQSSELMTVRERCREYYKEGEFVSVMNIDTQPFSYVFTRPEDIEVTQPDPVTRELYRKNPPVRVTLQPGETKLVPAYEADLMIKSLMDKMVLRQRGLASDGKIKESIMDPETQHRYIKQIFQGTQDLVGQYNKSLQKPDVSKDLELDEPTIKRPTLKKQAA